MAIIKNKTELLRAILSLLFSFGCLILLGEFIWDYCSCDDYVKTRKELSVQLFLPTESIVEVKQSVFKQEEYELDFVKKEFEQEVFLSENPFEEPMELKKPVILEEKKKEVKKEIKKSEMVKKELKKVEVSKPETPKDTALDNRVAMASQFPLTNETFDKNKKEVTDVKVALTPAQANANSKYLAKVMKVFEKNKKYPEAARKRRLEGRIIVGFSIYKDGKTGNVAAKTKTPKELAEAAEILIKNAKLPVPPECWQTNSTIEIPITYKLR